MILKVEPRTIGQQTVYLPQITVENLAEWSEACAGTEDGFEFGNLDVPKRTREQVAYDTLLGKLGEMAVAKFLKDEFGIDVDVDLNIYPDYVGDRGDLHIFGQSVAIKATARGAYLLLDVGQLASAHRRGVLETYFILVRPIFQNRMPTGKVILLGYAHLQDLVHPELLPGTPDKTICADIPGTSFAGLGSDLPGTNVTLQANNVARHMSFLETDWEKLIDILRRTDPTPEADIPF